MQWIQWLFAAAQVTGLVYMLKVRRDALEALDEIKEIIKKDQEKKWHSFIGLLCKDTFIGRIISASLNGSGDSGEK